jgi:hypothetical protein
MQGVFDALSRFTQIAGGHLRRNREVEIIQARSADTGANAILFNQHQKLLA